jgi:hypothetical protein
MLMKPVSDNITTWLAKEIKMDRIRTFFEGIPYIPSEFESYVNAIEKINHETAGGDVTASPADTPANFLDKKRKILFELASTGK